MKKSDWPNAFVLAMGLAVLLAHAPPAWADPPETPMVVRSISGPFLVYGMENHWAQRTATVENLSGRDRRARVALHTQLESGESVEYAREFAVPAGTLRRALMAIRPGRIRLKYAKAGQQETELSDIEMRYVLDDLTTGTMLASTVDLDKRALPTTTRVAMLFKEQWEHDQYKYFKELPAVPGFSNVRMAGLASPMMPTQWYGYEVISAVFLWGMDLTQVPPTAVPALMDWVRRGGTLVIVGSPETPAMLAGPLGEAAGVAALGSHTVSRIEASGLPAGGIHPAPGEEVFGFDLDFPMPMTEVAPTTAEVLMKANGLPLLTRRVCGNGRVLFLAVAVGALHRQEPPPVAEREPTPLESARRADIENRNTVSDGVWSWIGRSRRRLPTIDPDRFVSPAMAALNEIAGRRGPPRWAPLAGLLAGIGAVGAGGLLLRRRRRGELLWLMLVPGGLLLAVGLSDAVTLSLAAAGVLAVLAAVLLAVRRRLAPLALAGALLLAAPAGARLAWLDRQTEQLTYIGLLTDVGDGLARGDVAAAYSSGPGTREVRFCSGAPARTLRDAGQRAASGLLRSRMLLTGAGVCTEPQSLSDATRGLYASGVQRRRLLPAELTFGPEGLAGEVTNATDVTVERAVLLIGGNTYQVGDLQPGRNRLSLDARSRLAAVRYVDPPEGRSATEGEFVGSLAHDQQDIRQNTLVRRLATLPSGPTGRPRNQALLIGYAPVYPGVELEGGSPDRRGWSVIVQPIRPGPPQPGSRVRVPVGMAEVQLRGMPWRPWQMRFDPLTMDVSLDVSVRPPEGIGPMDGPVVRLRIDAGAPGYDLAVEGIPAGRRRGEELKRVSDPRDAVSVTVDRAERFRWADGSYRFRANFTQRAAEDATVMTEMAIEGRITSIDAGLEGTQRGR